VRGEIKEGLGVGKWSCFPCPLSPAKPQEEMCFHAVGILFGRLKQMGAWQHALKPHSKKMIAILQIII